jgi:hypothetical protein
MSVNTFQAGVGRVVITPPLSAPHASWGAQVHVLAEGLDADLWATVLVVDDGATRAAWVDLDLIILTNDQARAVQEAVGAVFGIAPGHVKVTVTHNHAGPPPSTWNWTKEGQAALEGYYALLPEYAAGAARLALQALRPARIAAGAGSSHVAVNRRETAPGGRTVTGVNPGGQIDPHVLVARIDGVDEQPIAVIVGYTMHPTTMGPSNRVMSPDWPGHLKRTVEHITGATCLFIQGATGDIGPGPDGFTDDLSVIQRLGAEIGCEAARVYFGLRLPAVRHEHERTWESGAPLGVWKAIPEPVQPVVVSVLEGKAELPVGEQVPLDQAEQAVADAQARLDELKAANADPKEIEAATFVMKRANMTRARSRAYGSAPTYQVSLHLLQIGPVVLAGTEGEPFSGIGRAIKERSPFPHTWFGGYTGGWAGYIPTPEEYPAAGYEIDTSPFAPEAASALVEGAVAALNNLHQQTSQSAEE